MTRHKTSDLSYKRTLSYVLAILSRRTYSNGDLQERLRQKGVPNNLVQRILNRLVELQVVDDPSFAQAHISNRQNQKGHIALEQELRR
jgi:regulatory protein